MTKTIGLGRRTGAFEIVFLVDAVEGDPSAVAVDELQLRDCEHFSAEDDCPDDKSYRCANRVFFHHFLKILMLWSTSGELSIISVLWQVCISPLLLCDLTDDCGDRCVFQPNVFNQSHAGLMRTDSTAMRTLSDKPTLRSLTSRSVCFNHLAWDCFSGKLDLAKQAIRGQVQLLTTQSATAQGITFSLTAVKIQLRTA